MAEILALDDVTTGYSETHVLEHLSLSVAAGERLAIVGRNGMGKSTTLATMMGLTRLHGGTVRLHGRDITALPPHRRQAAGLGLVPQTRDIFPSLSVEENLIAGQRGTAFGLAEAYALFPRLKERRRNGGAQLSGGEQQMLAIARTLMGAPEVVLLDEPLEGLAPVICETLMAVFGDIAARGRTVVLVEQHAEMALRFAERVVILDTGRVVHDGPAAELLARPDLLERHLGVGLPGD